MRLMTLVLFTFFNGLVQAAQEAQVECQSQLVRTDLEVYEIQPKRPNTGVIEFTPVTARQSVGRLEISFAEGEFDAIIEVQKIARRSNWFKDQSLLKVTTSLFDGSTKALLTVSESHSNWIQSESMIKSKESYGPRVIAMAHIPRSLQAIYTSNDPVIAKTRSTLGLDAAMGQALMMGLVSGKEPYRIDTVCISTAPL